MAGVIAKATGEFTEEEGIKGMNDMFRKKGKEKYEEINTKAFKLGYNFI
jgi:2-oxoglutarate ferredoxin oxidoreductase subunit gamma